MTSFQKRNEDKSCNCRNSKCMKLYCECFSARLQCNKNCRCIDCHNQNNSELKVFEQRPSLQPKRGSQIGKTSKGCACRKSSCTKKYCQCFQAGVSCTELCKCIQCQNNQSLRNIRVITQLKKFRNDTSSKPSYLYPILLSQNNDHLHTIISQLNPLHIDQQFMEKSVASFYENVNENSEVNILKTFMEVLTDLQKHINENQEMKEQSQEKQQE